MRLAEAANNSSYANKTTYLRAGDRIALSHNPVNVTGQDCAAGEDTGRAS